MPDRFRVAVLCPGPSLPATYGPLEGRYERVVGVNKAAAAFRVHYWTFLDPVAFETFLPAVRARNPDVRFALCLSRDMPRQFRESADVRAWANTAGVRWLEDVLERWGPGEKPPPATMFSLLAALVLAAALGADEVDVFGADWEGDRDFAGEVGGNRGPDRWNAERMRYYEFEEWLRARGVAVRRVRATTEAPR